MQNKGAIQVFAILLALACIFHLSFTIVTNRVESKARDYAGGDPVIERNYLDSMNSVVVYNLGIVKYTYADAKQREMNLGLDLKGGMNVTLEVSVPDLLRAMSNNSQDSAFNKAMKIAVEQQKTSQRNFVDLFVDAYKSVNPQGRLASPLIFGHNEQEVINVKMTNDEVRDILKRESDMAINRTYEVLNARIDNFGVTQPNIQKLEGSNRILVELPGVQDPNRIQKLLEASAKLEFFLTYEGSEILPALGKVNELLAKINKGIRPDTTATDTVTTDSTGVALTPDTNKVDSTGLATLTTDTGKNTPDTSNGLGGQMSDEEFARENPLFSILQPNISMNEETQQQVYNQGPAVGFAAIKDTSRINAYLRMPEVKALLPKNLKLAWEQKSSTDNSPYVPLIALKIERRDGKAALSGDVITDASSEADDQKGGFRVTMKMNAEGSAEWAKLTKANIGKSIAIVLDDKVYSYPTVQDAITGGISTITGNFGYDDAKTLASVLKAGKLPTPAKIVEQAVVGPTLGKESIRAGFLSLVIAFALILVYIAFYYGKAGLIADVALLANLFFQLGAMAALNTTLTLAGITGLVLTIGMSVDANVLIFERIKEELREGKGLRMAVADGYKQASSAIIDSNVTSLLTALILMIFGGGPVKSFAITLFIGNLTSIFSCIFLARLFFEFQLQRKKDVSFYTRFTKNAFQKANINFVGRRRMYYIVSGIIVVAGLVSFFTKGFNLGVDLKGGRSYTVIFDNSDYTTQDVVTALSEKWGSEPIVKYYGTTDRVKIMTKYRYEDSGDEVDNTIAAEMHDALGKFYKEAPSLESFSHATDGYGIVGASKTGPTVARDVRIKSLWAIALSLMLIFLYVLIRFKGWQFGVGAILALAHDVIIVLAVFSIFDGILPFSLELDQAVIGSILTVIGYSINDKVIIFDRIREYLGMGRKGTTKGLINDAINSTLSRTINTSLSVLLVVLTAFFFGGTAIKGLTFALLIGVIVGTYSSICIATPMVVDLKKDDKEIK